MEQVRITIQGVKDLLNVGKSREEIAAHYGITIADCKELFKDERLKGLKAKKKRGFILVEETEDVQDSSDIIIGEDLTNVEENSTAEVLGNAPEVEEDSLVMEEPKKIPSWDN